MTMRKQMVRLVNDNSCLCICSILINIGFFSESIAQDNFPQEQWANLLRSTMELSFEIPQPVNYHSKPAELGRQHGFSPYAFNGGTVLALAGEDYALIASDTRLSEGFSIHSRDLPKLKKLTNTTVVGCCGFHGDVLTLSKLLEARLKMYSHDHNKEMTCNAVAAMLSKILYYRRFFPYYTYNIIAGLDEEGKGCVYSFDPVGSYEREVYRAGGSASSLLQPLLDNQVGGKNQEGYDASPIGLEKGIALVKDVFISAAERDIYTGDGIAIHIITKDGIKEERFPLRRD